MSPEYGNEQNAKKCPSGDSPAVKMILSMLTMTKTLVMSTMLMISTIIRSGTAAQPVPWIGCCFAQATSHNLTSPGILHHGHLHDNNHYSHGDNFIFCDHLLHLTSIESSHADHHDLP